MSPCHDIMGLQRQLPVIIGNCGGAGEECKQERFLACSLMSTLFDKNVSYEFLFFFGLSSVKMIRESIRVKKVKHHATNSYLKFHI